MSVRLEPAAPQSGDKHSITEPLLSQILHVTKSTKVKPVSSGHSKEDQILFFKTDYRLMQVKNIA